MIRIAMVKKSDNTLYIKAFIAEDFEDAQEAALRWVSTNLRNGDDMKIVNLEHFVPVVEHFVETCAQKSDAPVVHSGVLSEDDCKFLTALNISLSEVAGKGIDMPCCSMARHPNVVSSSDAVRLLEDLSHGKARREAGQSQRQFVERLKRAWLQFGRRKKH